jgi:hypothetical protein
LFPCLFLAWCCFPWMCCSCNTYGIIHNFVSFLKFKLFVYKSNSWVSNVYNSTKPNFSW